MSTVILFGGGDGGGLFIGANGVRPIPPFDPSVLLTLQATARVVTAAAKAKHETLKRKLGKEANLLSNLSVELVESVVGPLDSGRAIVFQDDDGGFTCGSNGKPPVPIPWPPSQLPTAGELIAAGVIEPEVVDLVRRANAQGIKYLDIFEKPNEVAAKVGIKLSERSAHSLSLVSPAKVAQIKDPTEREVMGFFLKVAQDGQYLDTWFTYPHEVAGKLGLSVSESAIEKILAGGGIIGNPAADDGSSAIAAGIAWGVVCIVIGIVCGETSPINEIVVDVSGMQKI